MIHRFLKPFECFPFLDGGGWGGAVADVAEGADGGRVLYGRGEGLSELMVGLSVLRREEPPRRPG